MKSQRELRGHYSIRRILAILAVMLIAIASAGIFYIHARQQQALIAQAAESQHSIVSAFLTEMDSALIRAENYLYGALYNNADVERLNRPEDDISHYHAQQRIAATLEQVARLGDFVECTWFYSPDGPENEFVSRNNYTGITLRELSAMQSAILNVLTSTEDNPYLRSDGWSLIDVDGNGYLLWMAPVGQAYCGAWVSFPFLFSRLEDWISGEGSDLILCTADARAALSTGGHLPSLLPVNVPWKQMDGEHINVCGYAQNADLAIEVILSREVILRDWKPEFDYAFASAVLLGFIVLTFALFQLLIYRPFLRLLNEMDGISANPDLRIQENCPLAEAAVLGRAINNLLDEIRDLKVQVYESQLREKDIQCQYLQIRLKSHFYQNCLSIIHAMARLNHTELIQELSMRLVEYLRFVRDDTDKFVLLEDELKHVRNYARIQELRFPGIFEYREDVSLELYDASIPPLILQTFIENSVEHGMNRNQKNWIHVKAHFEERAGKPGMLFTVLDNGRGFPQDELEAFCGDDERFPLSPGRGIGIRNVISRLKLLYDGQASISFYNRKEGGAATRIWLPMIDIEEDAI